MKIEEFTLEFKRYVLNEIDPLLKEKTPLHIMRYYSSTAKKLVELANGRLDKRSDLRDFLDRRRYHAKKYNTVVDEMFREFMPNSYNKTHTVQFKSAFAKKIECLLETADESEEQLAENLRENHSKITEEIETQIKDQSADINRKLSPMAVGMNIQGRLVEMIANQVQETVDIGEIDFAGIKMLNELLEKYSQNISVYTGLRSKQLYNIVNASLDAQDKMLKQKEQFYNLIMKKAMIYYKTAQEDKQALLKEGDITIEETEESKRRTKLADLLEVKSILNEENESIVELDS